MRWIAIGAGLLLVSGCGLRFVGHADEDPLRSRFSAAITALEAGRFEAASGGLMRLTASCDSGEWGERSLLALAALALDPRNPRTHPPGAAQLSARYLQIPDAPAEGRAVARTLYLLSIDLGSSPVEDPWAPVPRAPETDRAGESGASTAGFWRVADRFGGCDAPHRELEIRPLPGHPDVPLWRRMERVSAQRDSLRARLDTLAASRDSAVAAAVRRSEELRVRADSLSSELERLRGLLRSGLTPTSGDEL